MSEKLNSTPTTSALTVSDKRVTARMAKKMRSLPIVFLTLKWAYTISNLASIR
ncbi:MAG: hypothetical protein RMY16_09135 [Nostoc sp. DedQUE12b]|nr:hypothetical protein [Nostoc sp. DedQUE12b]